MNMLIIPPIRRSMTQHSLLGDCRRYELWWRKIPAGSACGTEFIEGSELTAALTFSSRLFPRYFTVKLLSYRQVAFDEKTLVSKASSNITARILVDESRGDCLPWAHRQLGGGEIIRVSTKYIRCF
jgi:hypothetical protein